MQQKESNACLEISILKKEINVASHSFTSKMGGGNQSVYVQINNETQQSFKTKKSNRLSVDKTDAIAMHSTVIETMQEKRENSLP